MTPSICPLHACRGRPFSTKSASVFLTSPEGIPQGLVKPPFGITGIRLTWPLNVGILFDLCSMVTNTMINPHELTCGSKGVVGNVWNMYSVGIKHWQCGFCHFVSLRVRGSGPRGGANSSSLAHYDAKRQRWGKSFLFPFPSRWSKDVLLPSGESS